MWTEIEVEEEFNIDEWYAYWMDEVDPRGSKRLSLEEFQMVGGGDY